MKLILKSLLTSLLFVNLFASSDFICNSNLVNNIYISFDVLRKNIVKKPLKLNNILITKIIINKNKHQITKNIRILDDKLTKKMLKNKLYKQISLSLEKQELCKKYKSGIGLCFLKNNKVIINYFDTKNNNLGKIIIDKKNCGIN